MFKIKKWGVIMSIMIKDLMDTNLMKDSMVLCGENGLDKIIKRISVHDSPVREDLIGRKILKPGDFIITSLFFQKSSGRLINDFIMLLHNSGCCGICISNQYLQLLPEEVVKYSNEIAFPIIQFDSTVPYAEIIGTTMELIIKSQNYLINEMRVERLIKDQLNPMEVRETAFEINSNFKEINTVILINNYTFKEGKLSSKSLIDYFNRSSKVSAFYYKKSIMIIITFAESSKKVKDSIINSALKEIDTYFSDYRIGISGFHNSLDELNQSINEAIFAASNSKIFNYKVSRYSKIGVNRLLIPLIGQGEMEKFYSMITDPVVNYDEHYKGDLFVTLISFVKNDGNYNKTAGELFQHVNTVRYRINKIKTILKMDDSDIKFYGSIALVVKIGIILKKI